MDKIIKTRSVVKDIKTLDKHSNASRTIKVAGATLQNTAEATTPVRPTQTSRKEQEIPEATATQSVTQNATRIAQASGRAASSVADKRRLAKKHAQQVAQTQTTQRTAACAASATTQSRNQHVQMQSDRAYRMKPPKASSRQPRITKTPASFQQSGGSPLKHTSAQAAKRLAQKTGYSQQTTARSARGIARSAKQGATAFTKMAIATAKSLGTAIAAVGGTAATMIIIISLVALIAVSPFGIFFTGGDMGDGNPTLREMIIEINAEHTKRIEEVKSSNPHDELAMSGTKTAWKEVLAIFAVKTASDPNHPLDVVTLDKERQKLLKEVFENINKIESRVEEKEIIEVVLEDDGTGTLVETSKTTIRKILYVTLAHTSTDQAAASYSFSDNQTSILYQLLDKKYVSTWQTVLYGVGRNNTDIVEIAATQIGNVGGAPYWSWYGFTGRVEWCACFVSWCANESGLIEEGLVPKFSYCPTGVQWFKDAGRWKDRGYVPQPGDIIFFDWQGDGVSDHVGIVESSDGSAVYTIEGNSGDACERSKYDINSLSVLGYGLLSL